IEPLDHGAIGALRGEGPDMAFEHDRFRPRPSAPIFGTPAISRMIYQFARAGNVPGLKLGGGIGYIDLVIDPEFIARTGSHAGDVSRKPAVAIAAQRMQAVQQQVDASGPRRPEPE